jgi:PKD repeat protein
MDYRAFSPQEFCRRLTVGGACFLLCATSSGVFAEASDFAAPILASDGLGNATQTTTGLDIANNAYIAGVVNDRILVKFIGPELTFDIPIPYEGLAQGDPDFETNGIGTTFLSYTQIHAGGAAQGREVYMTDNQGGGDFSTPLRLSDNPVDDFSPRLVLDFMGEPHLVWLRRVGGETQVLYWHAGLPGGDPVQIGLGDAADLFVGNDGVAHCVYSKDNDLTYVNNLGGSFSLPNQRSVSTTPLDPEQSASIGGDPDNNIFVAYESQNILYYTTKVEGGAFVPARVVDSEQIFDPRMDVRALGQVAIAYEKQGDVYYVLGQAESLNAPESLLITEGLVESRPSLGVDGIGSIHCSFIRDGDIYYTHNVGSPTAQFSATPIQGDFPLEVQFADLSSGAVQRWDWTFGDGSPVGHGQNPVHVYEQPGEYDVSLTVFTAGSGEATEVKEKYIFVQNVFERMLIRDQRVYPGQQGVWFPVVGWWSEPIEGYQIMATYPPALNYIGFEADQYTINSGGSSPDFFEVNDVGDRLEVGVIFDFQGDTPYRAASREILVSFIFNIRSTAPQGAKVKVDLVNNREISTISNVYSVGGQRRVPTLAGSTVSIEFIPPPFLQLFLRGDSDGSSGHDLSDAIYLLSFLFVGGPPPPCMDAADSDDSGELDLSDAIYILSFLFVGGAIPPPPFPNFGLDPTEDLIPDCADEG